LLINGKNYLLERLIEDFEQWKNRDEKDVNRMPEQFEPDEEQQRQFVPRG